MNDQVTEKYNVKAIQYLPYLPTTSKILNGEAVPFKDHYKEILKYYDIIQVPKSFINGASIDSKGFFFDVKP